MFVGNLPYHFRERDLSDYFGKCGRIRNITVGLNKIKNQSKGYAFVDFEDRRDAEDAFDKYVSCPHSCIINYYCAFQMLIFVLDTKAIPSKAGSWDWTGTWELKRSLGTGAEAEAGVGAGAGALLAEILPAETLLLVEICPPVEMLLPVENRLPVGIPPLLVETLLLMVCIPLSLVFVFPVFLLLVLEGKRSRSPSPRED